MILLLILLITKIIICKFSIIYYINLYINLVLFIDCFI